MLGIKDPYVALAYILCILSSLLCVAYAAFNWNKGSEKTEAQDIKWEKEEQKVEEGI